MTMQIRFVGPLGKVTGSCTWMRDETRGWSFLVDCGMQQGEPTADQWNAGDEWPFDPKTIRFVILTHAHVDHCGLIPELYKRGFEGTVYCTEETKELAELLLGDAAKQQDTSFELKDVERIHFHTPGGTTKFGDYHPVADDLFIRFFRSGHILGSVSATILWGDPKSEQTSIVFSGDIGPGREDQEVAPFSRHLMHPAPADFAVVESTYGDRARPPEETDPVNRRSRLAEAMDRAMKTGGTLAIPAFSTARTQDVLFDIHFVVASNPERYAGMDFILASPLAEKINEITVKALSKVGPQGNRGKVRPLWLGKQVFRDLGLDKDDPDHFDHAHNLCKQALCAAPATPIPNEPPGNAISAQWRSLFRVDKKGANDVELAQAGPRVAVMSSGMCDAGPAIRWLPDLLKSADNEVALTGYCAPGSIGNKLQELAPVPNSERRKLRDNLSWKQPGGPSLPRRDIKASISTLSGYSAHADQAELVDWVVHEFPQGSGSRQTMASKKVFIQHGHNRARKGLSEAIQKKATAHGLWIETGMPEEPSGWITLDPAR
ncbi:MBL fold metallo-hydrolase [Thioalkalivibrio sp. ALE14]|uniref:MBL fold metallo-hydrolase n=1 Tax=Thioalkalivibrio sp. ALE14 TaxID=1158168 RepID=UPI0003760198|nr:MBL fold metallo-hydrolase [Thioalkalivibrio sp. ALE14]